MTDINAFYTPARLLDYLTQFELRQDEAHGWGDFPMLYTLTLDTITRPATLRRVQVAPWEWTLFFVCPDGVNGDIDHDLNLYASRAQWLSGFLTTWLVYSTPATDESKARRIVIAIDERGRLYRVTRTEGDPNPVAEHLTNLDEDEHLLALSYVANALRGGPPVFEYAFDVKLMAIARVKATSEKAARDLLDDVTDIAIGTVAPHIEITSADIDGKPDLFEIDGNDPA
ncbi:hypothetical protein ACGFJC_47045 [Nonomuraea fuscirosea]|uniref:hypothetical protein n=1 Tax=Nonomuraea fuscirosea TaxID=1291556 RepID=UPI0037249A3D